MVTVTLRSASAWVDLLPEAGGAVARYASRRGRRVYDWLRPGNAQGPAAFPMVPFCSRGRDGRFPFGERLIELPANLPPQRHAIHGHGWQRPWVVEAHSQQAAALAYRHAADAWPWTYLARQEFSLVGDRLSVVLSVRNLAALTVTAAKVLGHLVVYTPADAEFFCVEPVSNVADAFNMLARGEQRHGALVLEPAQAVSGCIEFVPSYGSI